MAIHHLPTEWARRPSASYRVPISVVTSTARVASHVRYRPLWQERIEWPVSTLGPGAIAGVDAVPASHVLTQRELATAQGPTAYDAIRALRPLYLRTRGSREPPGVAIDFTARGTVDDLRRIPITHVREIRFLPGPVATFQYGPDHTPGVIVVLTGETPR